MSLAIFFYDASYCSNISEGILSLWCQLFLAIFVPSVMLLQRSRCILSSINGNKISLPVQKKNCILRNFLEGTQLVRIFSPLRILVIILSFLKRQKIILIFE